MSDGQGFDISVLEGKDRAELAAIAEQLGEKPGARAKKADIVALILRLVGADAPAEADQAEASAPAADVDVEGPAPVSSGEDPEGDDEAEAEGDGEPDADADEAAPQRRDGRSSGGRNEPRGASDGEAGREQGGDQRTQPGNHQGGQGGNDASGDGFEDGVESGNRRRRRRGRDRDRQRDDEQVQAEPVEVEGMVDLREEGYGFLRLNGYLPSRDDAYISLRQTRQFGLRTGDIVRGKSRPAGRNEKNPALLQVDDVNGHQAHNQPPRARFDELTPVYPSERLPLELAADPSSLTVRAIDLIAPIGKGSRVLVSAPPRSDTTALLSQVVRSIEVNHPDVEVLVALVDERPEEITAVERWVLRGSVAATAFDRPADEHASVAELVVERAKRMVESGKDVVVVLDGLTRLARAHQRATGEDRPLDGGIAPSALFAPKRLFGAARKADEGGSLTIIATATVDSGSATDALVLEELRDTATTELRLDRRLAERQVAPAIDIEASSARHADALFDRTELAGAAALRQLLLAEGDAQGTNTAAVALLAQRLGATKTNAALLAEMAKG